MIDGLNIDGHPIPASSGDSMGVLELGQMPGTTATAPATPVVLKIRDEVQYQAPAIFYVNRPAGKLPCGMYLRLV
jgi:hypothetical protein